MIKINYGTSSGFEESIGDKYYCKNFHSAKKTLKRISEDYNEDTKEILKQYHIWVFDKKTCFAVGSKNITVGDLHIHIEEINLI